VSADRGCLGRFTGVHPRGWPRHNRLTSPKLRRPATGATVRAGGRCNCASSVISPARSTLRKQGWLSATLPRCPLHPQGGCGFARHGTYERVSPPGTRVARWYCPEGHCTFSLLPDCLAARLSGTLPRSRRWCVRPSRRRAWRRCAAPASGHRAARGVALGAPARAGRACAFTSRSRACSGSRSAGGADRDGVRSAPGGGGGPGGAARDRRAVAGRAARAARIRAPAHVAAGGGDRSNTVRGRTRRDARRRVSRAGKPPA
jgi:hypothetical protein